MSTVSPTNTPTPQPSTGTTITGQIIHAPSSVTNAAPGTTIQGQVTHVATNGTTTVQTEDGEVQIRPQPGSRPVPVGSQVTLQTQRATSGQQTVLVALQRPVPSGTSVQQPTTAQNAQPPQQPQVPKTDLAPGRVTTATVLQQTNSGAATASGGRTQTANPYASQNVAQILQTAVLAASSTGRPTQPVPGGQPPTPAGPTATSAVLPPSLQTVASTVKQQAGRVLSSLISPERHAPGKAQALTPTQTGPHASASAAPNTNAQASAARPAPTVSQANQPPAQAASGVGSSAATPSAPLPTGPNVPATSPAPTPAQAPMVTREAGQPAAQTSANATTQPTRAEQAAPQTAARAPAQAVVTSTSSPSSPANPSPAPSNTGAATVTPAANSSAGATQANPAVATPQAATAANPAIAPPTGSAFSAQIVSITPPPGQSNPAAVPTIAAQQLSTPPAAQQSANQITGTVVGNSAGGTPIVQTPIGLVSLNVNGPVPLNTRITFEATETVARADQSSAKQPAPLTVLAQTWPSLEEAIDVLDRSDPAAAANLSQTTVLRPGGQMTSMMLFFLAAVRGGDVKSFLGRPGLAALEKSGQNQLLSRLGDEFRTMGRASEPSDNGWRAFYVPVQDGAEMRQIGFYINSEKKDSGEQSEDQDRTHFMVDLNLSQLGPFQIDGLAEKESLDLVVRTSTPLPGDMRKNIHDLFQETLAGTGIQGTLNYRVQAPQPVPVIDEAALDPSSNSNGYVA